MKTFLSCLIILGFFITTSVSAAPHGGGGQGQGHGQGHQNAGDFGGGGDLPPGLQNKGTPYGLEKQNKTPHGWSKGKKKGWHKSHHGNQNVDKNGLDNGNGKGKGKGKGKSKNELDNEDNH